MLKSIIELRKTSTVLTTHTMSEAEQLCDKIGIMINGQFRCFGSLSQLKENFGSGYTITICNLINVP